MRSIRSHDRLRTIQLYGFLLLTIRLCKSPPERAGLSGRMPDRKKHAPKPPTTLPVPRRTSSSFHSRSRPKWPRRHAPPYGGRTAPKLPLSSCVFLILVGFASVANPHAPSTTRRRAATPPSTCQLRRSKAQDAEKRYTLSILQQLHARCPNTELAPPVSHLVEVVEDGRSVPLAGESHRPLRSLIHHLSVLVDGSRPATHG